MSDFQIVDANLRAAMRFFGGATGRGEIASLPGGVAMYSGLDYGVFNIAMLTGACHMRVLLWSSAWLSSSTFSRPRRRAGPCGYANTCSIMPPGGARGRPWPTSDCAPFRIHRE